MTKTLSEFPDEREGLCADMWVLARILAEMILCYQWVGCRTNFHPLGLRQGWPASS